MLGRVNYPACFILLSLVFSITSSFSQELTVSGVIRDQNTYEELRGVNIFIKGTQIGTTSDFAGKYSLKVPSLNDEMIVVFQHIAYVKQEIPLSSVKNRTHIDLQPRVIPLDKVEVEAEGSRPEIVKDLPQTVSVIESRDFEIRGYTDAGDLLRVDHSVQVEEELSGEKTVSIRGGNPDEVVVMYNGVKLNNSYNNVFDLSLIDLEDIDRFELIKGSNTALYGPESFSGVINIVPKTQYDYNIRFQQRLGTYRSGNWGLHLYKKFDKISSSYSLKRGAYRRRFVDVQENNRLENTSLHHTVNLNYRMNQGTLGGMWIYSSLDYDNERDNETLDNLNNLFSVNYAGDLFELKNVDLSASFKQLDEDQTLRNIAGNTTAGSLDRHIKDRAVYLKAQKEFRFSDLDLLVAYQFEQSNLDFLDERKNFEEEQVGLEQADLQRQHHGLVSILKYHGETGSDFLKTIDLDISFRHDRVHDSQDNTILRNETSGENEVVGRFDKNDWNESMFKFAVNVSGVRQDLLFNAYMSFGSNTKFPTLFQQISSPLGLSGGATQPNLSPEKNRALELSVNLTKDVSGTSSIYGWQISGNFFQNYYENKFRTFTTPGIPVVFYDNVQDARISGFEGKVGVFLFSKKVSVDLGLSRYYISERAAFPFKSDYKRTLTFNFDHAGYSFQLLGFHESEQAGWLRFQNGEFAEVELPANTNVDVHLSKTFKIYDFEVFLNASGRNLLNEDDVTLEGLAIRDRRYYITVGAQY